MSRDRFELLKKYLVFFTQPILQGTMFSKQYRWMLVEEIFQSFNVLRQMNVIPSECICADNVTSRWYSLGEYWLDVVLSFLRINRPKPRGSSRVS